jgi:ABC-type antimicrobial peptide transport system permease subunit
MMLSDVRHAFRSLISQPLWTLAAIACLAIGTGANTASLSVINAILLRPLPFSDPDQLMVVGLRETSPPQNRVFTVAEYREVATQTTLFSQLAARTFLPVSVAAGGQARMVQAELVSANYFDMLRVVPMAGSLLAIICGLGLFLSAAGLYGVVAFGARERTREFGLRMALGARPVDIARQVLRRGLRLAMAGLVLGLVASLGLTRLLGSVVNGVGSPDAPVTAIVGGVLLAIALAASYLPARWATRIHPAVALRGD